MNSDRKNSSRIAPGDLRLWQLAILLGVALCFVGSVERGLWGSDEPRDAAISLEMSHDGNFLIPHLAGVPFVEKPPLYFAVAAGCIRALGAFTGTTGAVRICSALWGVGILLMTWLLARRLAKGLTEGQTTALSPGLFAAMATVLLATMCEFIKNSHWIRVDITLAFFIIAALWCFAEVYFARRSRFLLWGAVFTAGAFLSKGMIGPALIGAGWAGMAVPWILAERRAVGNSNFFLKQHAAGLVMLMLLTGVWAAALFFVGGREIFDEWFFRNQLGRITGTAHLGHEKPGQWFFYIKGILSQTLPWTPLLLLWVVRVVVDLRKRGMQALCPERIFILAMIVGSLVILTVSVSKRSVYMLPLLPFLAVMCTEAIMLRPARWNTVYFSILWWCCSIVLALCSVAPLIIAVLPQHLCMQYGLDAVTWSFWNGVSGLCLAGFFYLFYRTRPVVTYACIALAIVAASVCSYKVASPLLEAENSAEQDIGTFIEQIDPAQRPRIAGFNIPERMKGYFSSLAGWKIHHARDEEQVEQILNGDNSQFDSVIISGVGSPPLEKLAGKPWHVVASAEVGEKEHHVRYLLWVVPNR